jgi:hypothetical protein
MRSSVTGIQFRIVEISLSDIRERPALIIAAQMPTESSGVNVTFLRSDIKYFGLVAERKVWLIGPRVLQNIVMYSFDGDRNKNPLWLVAASGVPNTPTFRRPNPRL